ncbi:MAG: lipid-A-disaccharide synthase [Bacteroidales bacterium]|nr:lipid-A-disaccharide synthase [Bacteroidales bacterium]MCF8326909.1 lipid-A-disaccharide synthase [Bacteroidales bacterium]
MRYYIIAGEASGDMHAANLMGEIQNLDTQWDFRFWGGDRMQEKGGFLVKHYKYHSFMGFAEVLTHLPVILKNLNRCKQDILKYKPDVLILVDYPGFNLRIAEFAHKQGIKVAYYISPQIWAWKENRVHKIKKNVDSMFVILPFEKEFYKKHDMDVTFVGHPLLDELKARRQTFDHEQFKKENELDERPVVALLPGSRKQEIKRMLPVMVDVANKYPEYQYVIAGTKHIPEQLYRSIIKNRDVTLLTDKTYPILQIAKAGMITSGTASLETALFYVPQLVMYKASRLSYWIAKKLVNLNYISVANLVFDREVFKEFIQNDCNVSNVSGELYRLLVDQSYRKNMHDSYQLLEEKLGGSGASQHTAKGIVKMAKK